MPVDNSAGIASLLARQETCKVNGIELVLQLPTAEDALLLDTMQLELAKVMPATPNAKMSDAAIKGARNFQVQCIKAVLHCSEEEARLLLISNGQPLYLKVSGFLGIEGEVAELPDPT